MMSDKDLVQIYDENSIRTLAPREAVRSSLGMYIGNNGESGFHHLAEEIICNSMDEAIAGYGKEVIVYVDSALNKLTVADSGRGIPFRENNEGKYAIMEMCTALHSGGKMSGQTSYKTAIGLNGVGATITNALSTYFRIDVVRQDGKCSLEFNNGETTGPLIEDCKNKVTGSTVSFIPDAEVFGNIKWNKAKLLSFLQIHAVMNNNIAFTLVWDKEPPVTYKYKNGVEEYLKIKVAECSQTGNKAITKPFNASINIQGGHKVEFAIQYLDDGPERIYAFTNGAYNPDLGTHVTGFKSAFTSLINNKAREHKFLDIDSPNMDGNLLRKGMVLVLSLKLNERPQFNEQQKLKLTSDSARKITSQAVGQMNLPKADIEAIVKKALIEKKAEDAAQRKRDAEKRISAGGRNLSMKDLPVSFSDAIDKKGTELFLCEGKSAAGSAKEGRDKHKQAIYAMKGKPLNTNSKELADLIKNTEIKDILSILGCGIGEKFNMNNLRYDKIVLLSDADVK